MSTSLLALFVAGLVLLLVGAELLVRGAARLAGLAGISPLVVGLTVVAWGTGSPELAVALSAALEGSPDLTIGNVVGSNIANILLILGCAALIVPLKVSQRLVRLDVPLMIAASILTLVVALDGRISTAEGMLFVALLITYTVWITRGSRRAGRAKRVEQEGPDTASADAESTNIEAANNGVGATTSRWPVFVGNGLLIAAGLFLLVKGSDWLVEGASSMAAAFGLSTLVIGLTIVAIGTSLPELATSAVAGLRGQRDIAVGNAIGSNIFNLLAVLGVTAIVAPDGIGVAAAARSLDIPIMIAVAIACMPVFFDGNVIHRWNGALFVALYAGYITFLVLQGTQHAALTGFSTVMLAFVLPLVTFTLVLVAVQSVRRR